MSNLDDDFGSDLLVSLPAEPQRTSADDGRLGAGGTSEAWDAVYPDCDRVLRSTLASCGLSGPDRDDCYQEVWVELLKARPLERPGTKVEAWITTVARNKAMDVFRRRSRCLEVPLVADAAIEAPGVEGDDGAWQAPALVRDILGELERQVTVRSFRAFHLRWIEGLSTGEIGAALGLAPAQVRLRQHRVMQVCKRLVGERRDTQYDYHPRAA